ncbi:unnamed protein product [Tetraodon nigroviridis]|uniref:Chromosome 3 SCAF14679, whole genome shotgun sequence n=2 Tax=Tetraodon nigroviridis TaxID=99883 RepID=Q4SAR0_TETNG|nr:unnamed protein product [Tetraodon nigroviridis]
MSIIYGVLSAFSLVAPVVVTVIGPQLSMFFSGLMYRYSGEQHIALLFKFKPLISFSVWSLLSCYIAMFIYPYTWSFYAASVLVGLGAADKDRQTVFISLTVISLVGCFLLFLIRKPDPQPAPSEASQALLQSEQSDSLESSTRQVVGFLGSKGQHRNLSSLHSSPRTALCSQALDAFVKACKIFVTKEMLLLSFSIAYTGGCEGRGWGAARPSDRSVSLPPGLELTFYSGVYGTCIGAMTQFGHDAKSLIGISGICIGVGEILGGGLFGMLNKSSRFGRNPVVLLGLFTHFVAFYLIFLNIASDAPIAPEAGTDLQAYVPPSVPLALFCSFLLGFGDSCFNTQLLSIVGFVFRNNSAPAFAAFRFIQVSVAHGCPAACLPRSCFKGCLLSSPSWRPWPSSTATTCCSSGSCSSWWCPGSSAPSPSSRRSCGPSLSDGSRTSAPSDVQLVSPGNARQPGDGCCCCCYCYDDYCDYCGGGGEGSL